MKNYSSLPVRRREVQVDITQLTTSMGFLFSVTGAYNKSFPSISDKQSRTGVARSTAVIDSGRTRTTSSASWIVRIVDLDLPLLKRATSKSSRPSAYLDSSNGDDATYSRSVKRPKDVVITKCECVARGGAKIDNDPDPASRMRSTASANDA